MSMLGAGSLDGAVLECGKEVRVDFPGCSADAEILFLSDGPEDLAWTPEVVCIDDAGFTVRLLGNDGSAGEIPSTINWIAMAPGTHMVASEPSAGDHAHGDAAEASELDLDAAFYEVLRQAKGKTTPKPVPGIEPFADEPHAAPEHAEAHPHNDDIHDWLSDYVVHSQVGDAAPLDFEPDVHHHAGGAPCYVKGTMITTLRGQVDVAQLAEGDMILTRDRGFQALRRIVRTRLAQSQIMAQVQLSPVVIRPGALGPGRPAAELRVSPHHRVLLTGEHAELLAGQDEVLISVHSLVDNLHVLRDRPGDVTYVMLLFDAPEVIYAQGTASESLSVDMVEHGTVTAESRAELHAFFPDLVPVVAAETAAQR